MDDAAPSNGHVEPGISMRNGPVEEEATGGAVKVNGASKRKASMGKSYAAAASDSDDDIPLVGLYKLSIRGHTY